MEDKELKFFNNVNWPKPILKKIITSNMARVKQGYLQKLCNQFEEYFNSLFALDGFKGEDVQKIIRAITINYTSYVWDLPASQAYHHAERFGLLKHSLEVAYLDAKKASKELLVNDDGVPSVEKTRKERMWRVLSAWLIGLFHDVGKVFDVILQCKYLNKTILYHPLRGGVLDFYISHSGMTIELEWRQGRGMHHMRKNMYLFALIMPLQVMQCMPQNIVTMLLNSLYDYKDAGDKESVKQATEEENKERIIRLLSYIFSKDGGFNDTQGRPCAYQLDENVYAVVMPVFFQQLASYSKDVLDTALGDKTIINIFKQYEWIYCNNDDQYYSKLKFQKGNIALDLSLAIVKASPFIKAGAFIKSKIKFLADEYDKVTELLQSPAPVIWFAGTQDQLADLAAKRDARGDARDAQSQSGSEPADQPVDQPQPGQGQDEENGGQDQGQAQASSAPDHQAEDAQAGAGQEQQEQSQAKQQPWDEKICTALNLFLQKLQNQEYSLNKTGGIGYVGVDNLLYLLYPKWVDEVFEVKSNFDSVYLNRYRQKILFKLLDSGYLNQYKSGYLFAKLKVMYLSDGKQIYSPEMQYIRLNIDKLINFNPEFEKYLK
jgi:hypothetical protein